MKVLILANSATGLVAFRKELLQKMRENGYELYVACPDSKFTAELKGSGYNFIDTPLERRGTNPFKDIKLIMLYKRIVKEVKPDFVITYTIKPNIYGGYVCRRQKIPYFVNITGLGTTFQKNGLGRKIIERMYKMGLKDVAKVFFENEGNLNVMVDRKIVSADKCITLSGAGVNLERFCYEPMEESEVTDFLFMGRLMREKGIDELFEVAKKLKKENAKCTFTFIGSYEENYKAQVEELQAQGIISFGGMQDDVRPFIKKSQCVILPSYHEGMSNALLEGASMGRPLITSDIHGCKEAVIDGKNGYLCQPKNVEALYEAVKKFVELPFESKEKMGKASRQIMEISFDKNEVISKTLEIFESKGKL